MKLLTFEKNSQPRLGALLPHGVVDLTASQKSELSSMMAIIHAGDLGIQAAQEVVASSKESDLLDPEKITWMSVLPVPEQIRDCLGFEEHLKNTYLGVVRMRTADAPDPEAAFAEAVAAGAANPPEIWYQQPLYYKANRFACSGHDNEVEWPLYSQIMDYELEMACVIGTKGKDIRKEDATNHIFGYTIFNDLSARDAQMTEMPGMLGPAKGKDFDKSNVLGPVIVTKDEIANPYNLLMNARINGEQISQGSSSTIHWKFEDMIAHISKGETLYPGEVIASGTVGWGSGLENNRLLQDGDTIELEIENIGKLRSKIRTSK